MIVELPAIVTLDGKSVADLRKLPTTVTVNRSHLSTALAVAASLMTFVEDVHGKGAGYHLVKTQHLTEEMVDAVMTQLMLDVCEPQSDAVMSQLIADIDES